MSVEITQEYTDFEPTPLGLIEHIPAPLFEKMLHYAGL